MPRVGDIGDSGLGSTLDFTPDSTGIKTEYCIIRANGPTTEVAEIETSHSCSTAAEFIADLPDNGTFEIEYNFDPDVPTFVTREVGNIVFHFPPKATQAVGATFTGRAFVKSAPIAVPIRDRMTQTVTFRISGALTHAPGA